MKALADLLDGLIFAPARTAKLALLADYFRTAPDPDRGWVLAALAQELKLKTAKPALLRGLVTERVDPVLFGLSYDYVGDLAETVALIWPGAGTDLDVSVSEVVERLNAAGRAEVPGLVAAWLDALAPAERYALVKLVSGGLRVGVSACLAKTGLAQAFDLNLAEIEEIWHGLEPPYTAVFDWAEGRAEKPSLAGRPVFRPFMLAHPLEDADPMDPAQFLVEWKWDGIRVQLVAQAGAVRLYSRTGDDISAAFPDLVEAVDGFVGVLDGELLVRAADGSVAPFNHLQQRLNRKTVSAALMRQHPAFLRLYDILFDGPDDVRAWPIEVRRHRLEHAAARLNPERFDLSALLPLSDWDSLAQARATARAEQLEGLMLKRRGSAYVAGRQKGLWFKWKRDPLTADLVLMYAQRGHGKRSSYYSDYTFGAWSDGHLTPVGKAYFGFTDEELRQLDRFVRTRTVNRFGPVREVEKSLVLEIAFDSLHPSPRHKSGLAMRFPRIKRIRWDKPAEEAETLERLAVLIDQPGRQTP
ncbi:MAG: cisplatin damage response ATP-dependent DNA ligase [Rhodothalassiaceae bacterium]